jgi:SAM-dependent methyltransferase
MRDPEGRLRFVGDRAVRSLYETVEPPAFLKTDVAHELVEANLLIGFELKARSIESPRLPFVTMPTEWTDAQFHAAAMATLDVSERILNSGYELKDASAWNVLFRGSAPIFCDHLSFRPIETAQWWAFGQYCRNFMFPLLCAARGGLHAKDAFMIDRDGLTADRARRILGLQGLFCLAAPLLQTRGGRTTPVKSPSGSLTPLHHSLFRYARAATPAPAGQARSAWSRYTEEREHYAGGSADFKRSTVAGWLRASAPAWVLDIGCNTGEFSRIALDGGSEVIAIDYDHDSVQQVFHEANGNSRLYPAVVNIADLSGGRGWGAAEIPGVLERLENRADMLLMLAVVHHIHLSESIPLAEIADLCRRLTKSMLVLEIIGADDPLTGHLAAQRRKDPAEFSAERQMLAFSEHFDVMERVAIPDTQRELVLFRRRA